MEAKTSKLDTKGNQSWRQYLACTLIASSINFMIPRGKNSNGGDWDAYKIVLSTSPILIEASVFFILGFC